VDRRDLVEAGRLVIDMVWWRIADAADLVVDHARELARPGRHRMFRAAAGALVRHVAAAIDTFTDNESPTTSLGS